MQDRDQDPDGIKDQHWFLFDDGAQVVTADGEEWGTVRTKTPHYLTLRVRENLFADAEVYVPRDLVDRVEGDQVMLRRSKAELEKMDLTKPPAVRAAEG
jgi:hypothetical protein